jgi:hypothetical protein
MNSQDRITLCSLLLVLALMLTTAVWFLPQKWQACQKLYDNRIAQIICFASK